MLDDVHETYNTIIEHNGKHEYLFVVFNQVFQNLIQHEWDEWDVGKDISQDELMSKTTEKYHKIVQWG